MNGTKHLVECHCVLPQYRHKKETVFHKFVVFSEIDENDNVISKFAQCNNCGVIHKVVDICKSEIIHGIDESVSLMTINDIKPSISKDVVSILETYSCDFATWENVKFIYDNSLWGSVVTISRDEIDNNVQLKVLTIKDENKINIDTRIRKEVI
jgi:DNA-directed RNA polymerase subunit F